MAICYVHYRLYLSVEHEDKTRYCIAAIKSYLLDLPIDENPQEYILNKLKIDFFILYDYFTIGELLDMIEYVLLDYEQSDYVNNKEVVSGSDTTD